MRRVSDADLANENDPLPEHAAPFTWLAEITVRDAARRLIHETTPPSATGQR